MNWLLLVISHLICFAIGGYLFLKEEEPKPVSREDLSKRLLRPPLPKDVNPLGVATSADYQGAFEDYFADGGDTINSERLFRQWTLVDPDAAILAISKIYHIHGASNMLSNLVGGGMEKELAASLVKYYGDFEYISHFDIHWITGRALAKLAEDDLDQALDLIRKLPVSSEKLPLDDLISGMDGPRLGKFLERVAGPDADLIKDVDAIFWQSMATRAWRVLSPKEYEGLFHRFEQPEAIKSLTQGALREAHNFGRHDRFVHVFKSLPRIKQDYALEVFEKSLERASTSALLEFRAASEQLGAARLLEVIQTNPRQ